MSYAKDVEIEDLTASYKGAMSLEGRQRMLLLKVADLLDRHSSAHKQANWVEWTTDDVEDSPVVTDLVRDDMCGTQACIAGWGVLLDLANQPGQRILADLELSWSADEMEDDTFVWTAHPIRVTDALRREDVSWWVAGAAALGLSFDEANVLFSGDMTPPCGTQLRVSDVLRLVALGVNPSDIVCNDELAAHSLLCRG